MGWRASGVWAARGLLIAVGMGVSGTAWLVAQTAPAGRAIAITVDDLPAMDAMAMDAAQVTALNRKLLATLVRDKVPAIGFVNEQRLYKTGEVDARIAVLRAWVDAGMELGNHTFSHTSLNEAGLRAWEDDVVQGESVTRPLLEAKGKKLKYLRQPYLDDGPDLGTRRAAVTFLTERGYRVAPVTVDPRDWYFADIYDDAHGRGDKALMERVAKAWLAYTGEVLTHDEAMCERLLGYQPKQVVLLHATWLEADHLGELLALLRGRGYGFIKLDEALTDPAYAQPDEYVSDVGATEIVHWAVTRGMVEAPEKQPAVTEWVRVKHAAFDAEDAK